MGYFRARTCKKQIIERMQLFYSPNIHPTTTEFTFSSEESKHIIRVLRKKVDDIIHITDGKGHLFRANIILAEAKTCAVTILEMQKKEEKSHRLHMVVAPTKVNDRFEWFLEKATELGIQEISPIICDRSERKTIKMERMEKVVQTAMKQSLQTFLPQLNPPVSFKEFLSRSHKGQLFIAHCDEDKKTALGTSMEANTNSLILIGPEGDFSSKEIEMATNLKFQPVALGDTRLRTETAAIVACHSTAFTNEL